MSAWPLPALDPARPDRFPPIAQTLDDPDGLLAWGGDLSPARLLAAYRRGIFPWYAEGQPPLWWCPGTRAVFDTDGVRLSSRFRRGLRRCPWTVRADTAFDTVLEACARAPRPGQDGTWITADMQAAYARLHRLGHAHSVEVYDGDRLAGGLYGVAVGRLFFAESMVSLASGGSKVALAALARRLAGWGWPLIDAQIPNPHLDTLGARHLPRDAFLAALAPLVARPGREGSWREAFGEMPAATLAATAAA